MSIGNALLKKSIQVFSKPNGLKYKQYWHGYIHYSNRRHTQKITPGREKVLTLQTSVRILKNNQKVNPR